MEYEEQQHIGTDIDINVRIFRAIIERMTGVLLSPPAAVAAYFIERWGYHLGEMYEAEQYPSLGDDVIQELQAVTDGIPPYLQRSATLATCMSMVSECRIEKYVELGSLGQSVTVDTVDGMLPPLAPTQADVDAIGSVVVALGHAGVGVGLPEVGVVGVHLVTQLNELLRLGDGNSDGR